MGDVHIIYEIYKGKALMGRSKIGCFYREYPAGERGRKQKSEIHPGASH